MIKKRDKKGQFYLIAAILIISIIVGFVAVSNYAKKGSQVRIYDLGAELGIESGEVLDFGVYNSEEWSMESLLSDFAEKYSEYAGEGKSLYFVFGNPSDKDNPITTMKYGDVYKGTVSSDIGSEGPIDLPQINKGVIVDDEEDNIEIHEGGDGKIKVSIELPNGDVKDFSLNEGENFIFVIYQEIDGEQHVTSSEND